MALLARLRGARVRYERALLAAVALAAVRTSQLEPCEPSLRWLARYCLEGRNANLAGLRQAADAFALLESEREDALEVLRRLARR